MTRRLAVALRSPLVTFAGILAIGAVGGIALGGSVIASTGLFIALVASFAVGHAVGREEAVDAASPRTE